MAILTVVPMHQLGDPPPGLQPIFKLFERQLRPVFQGLEQGFRVRVAVTHGGAAATMGHAQALHRRQHGFALHGGTIV